MGQTKPTPPQTELSPQEKLLSVRELRTEFTTGEGTVTAVRDVSFDLVTCSLFFHHLEPPEIQQFTREAMRVARVAFLVNDLRRSWAHL